MKQRLEVCVIYGLSYLSSYDIKYSLYKAVIVMSSKTCLNSTLLPANLISKLKTIEEFRTDTDQYKSSVYINEK